VDRGLWGVEQLCGTEHPGQVDDSVGTVQPVEAAENVTAIGQVECPRFVAGLFGGGDRGLAEESGPAGDCDLHVLLLFTMGCGPTLL
jgi:hypothetical protein